MPEAELAHPAGPADLFRAFNRLALQGFGGVLPVAQRNPPPSNKMDPVGPKLSIVLNSMSPLVMVVSPA